MILICDKYEMSNDTVIIDGVQLDVWIVSSDIFNKADEYLHILYYEKIAARAQLGCYPFNKNVERICK